MAQEKIIFVGEPNICKQIAYVLAYEHYEILPFTADLTSYTTAKIIVCAFKRQHRIYQPKTKIEITYLDDICRWLDRNFKIDRRIYAREIEKTKRFGALRIFLKKCLKFLKVLRQPLTLRHKKIIDRLPVYFLKPSELLLKVIYSPPTNIVCDRLEKVVFIAESGDVWACCDGNVKIPLGNIKDQAAKNIYDNALARIIKLSSLNRSYCLCDLNKCQSPACDADTPAIVEDFNLPNHPQVLSIALDESCNLKCASCRKCYHTQPSAKEQQNITENIQALLQSQWLDQAAAITLACNGEVFHGQNYQRLLMTDIKRQKIFLLSNGTLFNEQKWALIKDKYQHFVVQISIDAATEQTYRRLRGGDFNLLLKNLRMLSALRQTKQIEWLGFCFVVQRDNYREMADFVRLAKTFHVDQVLFTHLNNWSTYSRKEYQHRCLIVNHQYLDHDFYHYLQDPIFQDPIVNLTSFQKYLANSAKHYRD